MLGHAVWQETIGGIRTQQCAGCVVIAIAWKQHVWCCWRISNFYDSILLCTIRHQQPGSKLVMLGDMMKRKCFLYLPHIPKGWVCAHLHTHAHKIAVVTQNPLLELTITCSALSLILSCQGRSARWIGVGTIILASKAGAFVPIGWLGSYLDVVCGRGWARDLISISKTIRPHGC